MTIVPDGRERTTGTPAPLAAVRILWAALLGGMVLMGALAIGVSRSLGPGHPELPEIVGTVLALAASISVLLAIAWSLRSRVADLRADPAVARVRERLLAAGPAIDAEDWEQATLSELGASHRLATITACALAEGGGLLAAIAILMEGPTPAHVAVLVLAIATLAAHWPTRRGFERFIAKRLLAAGLEAEQVRGLLARSSPRSDR